MLFLFVFGFLPQRFLLELDFAESGFAYPVVHPPLPEPPPPPPPSAARRPVARGPAERFWAEYVPLARAGEDSAAARLIEDYLSRYPNDLGATLEYGRTLWRLGELDAAIVAYRRALARGADGEAKRELARLLVAARRWGEALTVYAELARGHPDDLALLREYAETATWAERYDLAIELYAELVEGAPDDPALRLQHARVFYWAGRPERAAEALAGLPEGYARAGVDSLRAALAIALPPPETEVTPSVLEQARGLMLAGAVDSALVLYRLELSEGPGADSLLLEIADVFEFRADSPDSAMAYLHGYLARHPDDRNVRLRLARLLAWDGRYAEAEAAALTIVEAQPENAEAWVLLGDMNRWKGDRDAARDAYRRALQIDPSIARASEGLAAIDAQVNALLAGQGTIGPSGWFDYFADNDDFRLARFSGGWTGGSPRTRWGGEAALEQLKGFGPSGVRADMTAVDVQASGEHWFMDGGLNAKARLGAWIPDGNASAMPVLALALAAPDWGGSAYRLEYRHGPAYRETNTMEAAVADLRADVLGLEFYRPIAARWTASASARLSVFSGVGDPNQRVDASLSLLYQLDPALAIGYETRGLAFADSAPNPGRRLYWDPEWYWLNAGVVNWNSQRGEWELAAQALVGAAWMRERNLDPTLEAQFAFIFDAVRRFGVWGVGGRAAISQSRADGYRAFRLELRATRTMSGR